MPAYLQQGPDKAILPESSLTEEAVELLHEFVHPHEQGRRMTSEATLAPPDDSDAPGDEETGSDDDDDGLEDWNDLKSRPWYRRPSPLWYVHFSLISRCSP